MQFPSGSLWEGQLIWTTGKPVFASVKFGLKFRGSFGWPGDPCYSAWAKVRGCPEELAPLRVANSERQPWFQRTHGRGTEDVLAVKDCCLFVNCSGSDVWVRLSGAGTYGLVSWRCSHDLVDSTIRPRRLVPKFTPCEKCVWRVFVFSHDQENVTLWVVDVIPSAPCWSLAQR